MILRGKSFYFKCKVDKMIDNNLVIQYIINKGLKQKLEIRKDIFYVQMNVTNRCTDNCWHCYLKKNHPVFNESSAFEFIEILKQVNRWSQQNSKKLVVDLIGGDPLYKPDIYEILEYLFQENINYGIKGNPYLLQSNVEQLISLNCKRYQMSLDGLEKTHDNFRTMNSYQSTISAIQLLNKYQIPVNIKFTLSNKNVDELWPLLYELYKQNISISSFSVSRYYEKEGKGFHISKEYYDHAFRNLIQFYDMQVEQKDIRIHINLKEHLWIPYLASNHYLFKDFYELLERNPYLSSCSMISSNSTVVTSDGYYDLCPKISNFEKVKDINKYMEKKEQFFNKIKRNFCVGCKWKKLCLGCPAFYMGSNYKERDCDCFFEN